MYFSFRRGREQVDTSLRRKKNVELQTWGDINNNNIVSAARYEKQKKNVLERNVFFELFYFGIIPPWEFRLFNRHVYISII